MTLPLRDSKLLWHLRNSFSTSTRAALWEKWKTFTNFMQ